MLCFKEVTAVRSAKATLQCASGISPFKQSYQDRNNQHALYGTSKHPRKLSMKWSRHKTTLCTFLLLQLLAIHLADFPTWKFYTHHVFNSPQGTFFFPPIHLSNSLVNSFTLSVSITSCGNEFHKASICCVGKKNLPSLSFS